MADRRQAAPIAATDGTVIGVVLVFRDVAERRAWARARASGHTERERLLQNERAARSEAERANRIKDDFVAMVSHELRTPLNAILGWTDLLVQRPADEATLRHGLEVIARNTRLQAQLISDLLDVSRIVSGKLHLEMERVDLTDVIRNSVEALQSTAAEKGLAIARVSMPRRSRPSAIRRGCSRCCGTCSRTRSSSRPRVAASSVALRKVDGHAEITVIDTGHRDPARVPAPASSSDSGRARLVDDPPPRRPRPRPLDRQAPRRAARRDRSARRARATGRARRSRSSCRWRRRAASRSDALERPDARRMPLQSCSAGSGCWSSRTTGHARSDRSLLESTAPRSSSRRAPRRRSRCSPPIGRT